MKLFSDKRDRKALQIGQLKVELEWLNKISVIRLRKNDWSIRSIIGKPGTVVFKYLTPANLLLKLELENSLVLLEAKFLMVQQGRANE